MITALVLLLVVVGVFALQQYAAHQKLIDKYVVQSEELVEICQVNKEQNEVVDRLMNTRADLRSDLAASGIEVMRLSCELESTKYQLALSKTEANRQYEELVGVKKNLAAYEASN